MKHAIPTALPKRSSSGELEAVADLLGDRPALAVLRYGAHLYGTEDADSDIDLKAIFVPLPEEILLGKIDFALDNNPDSTPMQRGELDIQGYSLVRFLRLLGKGDMTALELLHAGQNQDATLLSHPFFQTILREARDMTGLIKQTPHGRARGALGKLCPDGQGKASRMPTRADIEHAVRILGQWREYHETGRITFPRPDRETLKALKSGTLKDVDERKIIADAFEAARPAHNAISSAADMLNPAVAEMRVLQIHRAAIDGLF